MADVPIVQAKLIVPSRLERLPEVRDLIEHTAAQAGFTLQEVQRIVTAAFEAVTNAVVHGSPQGPANSITIVAQLFRDRFVVQVEDEGPGFRDLTPREMPDVTARRGRGIALMRALMDRVELESTPSGRVTLTQYRQPAEGVE